MSERKYNRVKLNIPAHTGGPMPYPGEPVVTLNGVPLEGVVSIKLDVNGARWKSGFTTITLELETMVEGEFIVEEKILGET